MPVLNRSGGRRKRWRTHLQRWGVAARNTPLFLLCAGISLAIECYAIGGIYLTNTESLPVFGRDFRLAHVEAAISMGCGLAALWLSQAGAALRSDPRPEQRARAWGATALGALLLCVPIKYAGESFSLKDARNAHRAYAGSAAEAADRQLAFDPMADSRERADAAMRLQRSAPPTHAPFSVTAWLWAAFLYGANWFASAAGWRPKPETETEAARRERREERRVARERREARQKWQARLEQPTLWMRVRAVFRPLPPYPAWQPREALNQKPI